MIKANGSNLAALQHITDTFRHPFVKQNLEMDTDSFGLRFELRDHAYNIQIDESKSSVEITNIGGVSQRFEWETDWANNTATEEQTIFFELIAFLAFCATPAKGEVPQ